MYTRILVIFSFIVLSFSVFADDVSGSNPRNHHVFVDASATFGGNAFTLGYRYNVKDYLLVEFNAFKSSHDKDYPDFEGPYRGTKEHPVIGYSKTYSGVGIGVAKNIKIYKRLFFSFGVGYNYYTQLDVDFNLSYENDLVRERETFDESDLSKHGLFYHLGLGMVIAQNNSLVLGYRSFDLGQEIVEGISLTYDYRF